MFKSKPLPSFKLFVILIEPVVDHLCKNSWETSWEYLRNYSSYKSLQKNQSFDNAEYYRYGDIYGSGPVFMKLLKLYLYLRNLKTIKNT